LGDNPPPTFTKGRVCLVGDAAHATSPHHGAGAGMCIEDAAVLANILSDEKVTGYKEIEAALLVYDNARRERGSSLVQSSRRIGNTYEWLVPDIGDDLGKIEAEIKRRNAVIANVNVQQMCDDARTELGKKLSTK
jgi:salicylate hydroxylase